MKSVSTVLATLAMSGQSASWNYEDRGNNVSHWPEFYAECGYARQSPIDIPMSQLSSCKDPLELEWISQSSHYAILNAGHSLKAMPFEIDHAGGADISGLEILHHTNDTNIRLTNKFFGHYESSVNKEYCFDSLHFHWGRNADEGSEHTIDGKAYPLEVHLVHYSCDYRVAGDSLKDYASGEAAKNYDDDNVLAVIGVMFEIGAPNPILGKMLNDMVIDGIYENKAGNAQFPNKLEMWYTEFNVAELLPESREMISYLGSLTTPPCYETVRWHVMKDAMTVSEEQMELFRRLLEGTADDNNKQAPNYRPPQPRNGRTIWSCQEDVNDDAIYDDEESVSVVIKEDSNSDEWKNIAIGFIVLFALAAVICSVIMCYLCLSHQKMKAMNNRPPIPPSNQYEAEEMADDVTA